MAQAVCYLTKQRSLSSSENARRVCAIRLINRARPRSGASGTHEEVTDRDDAAGFAAFLARRGFDDETRIPEYSSSAAARFRLRRRPSPRTRGDPTSCIVFIGAAAADSYVLLAGIVTRETDAR
jgi:hypothetical protein